jgi:arylamine N-acetyltransferase
MPTDSLSRPVHDAPWLRLCDERLLARFLSRFGIPRQLPRSQLILRVTEAFAQVPYENLTKILKADRVISAGSALRHPDELIADFLNWGSGGTCFSLTASLVAILDGLGIETYPVLADRHYGADTHCGLMIVGPGGELQLLDPGYLLFAPVAIPREQPAVFETGFNRIELRPAAGDRLELYTIVKTNRKLRLTFKLAPVSDEAFGKAWQRSFAFEMMTYPVLTRQVNGCHQYLQGNVLAVRDSRHTERTVLTPAKQIEFISSTLGMNRQIVTRALELVNYGLDSAAAAR